MYIGLGSSFGFLKKIVAEDRPADKPFKFGCEKVRIMVSSILSWLQRSDIVKFDVETAIPCLVCIKAFRLNPVQVHNSTST